VTSAQARQLLADLKVSLSRARNGYALRVETTNQKKQKKQKNAPFQTLADAGGRGEEEEGGGRGEVEGGRGQEVACGAESAATGPQVAPYVLCVVCVCIYMCMYVSSD
jgi:hypothetical protein